MTSLLLLPLLLGLHSVQPAVGPHSIQTTSPSEDFKSPLSSFSSHAIPCLSKGRTTQSQLHSASTPCSAGTGSWGFYAGFTWQRVKAHSWAELWTDRGQPPQRAEQSALYPEGLKHGNANSAICPEGGMGRNQVLKTWALFPHL